MITANKARVPLAITCGVLFMIAGISQFLYSFLAFVSVIVVDLLGIVATLASSAVAAVPDEPYEIPYARSLAKTIAVTGMMFSITSFVTCCRFFYLRRVPYVDLALSIALCAFLAALHFVNSLNQVGLAYVFMGTVPLSALLLDRYYIERQFPAEVNE